MNKKTVRIIALVIAALLVLGIAGPFAYMVFSAPADNAALGEIDRQIGSVQNEIDELNTQINEVSDRVRKLDSDAKEYEKKAGELQKKLEAAERLENGYSEESEKLFRTMCEKGSVSYLDIIFSARSLTDFADRIVTARELADYDRRVMNSMKSVKEKIARAKADSDAAVSEQQKNRAELSAAREDLEKKKAERSEKLKQLENDEKAYRFYSNSDNRSEGSGGSDR